MYIYYKLTMLYQKPNSLWSSSVLDFSAFYKQDKVFYVTPFNLVLILTLCEFKFIGSSLKLCACAVRINLLFLINEGRCNSELFVTAFDLCQRRTLYSEAQERKRLWQKGFQAILFTGVTWAVKVLRNSVENSTEHSWMSPSLK